MADRAAQLATRYVRTHEAARMLGISPRTLEKYRCHGSGPTFRKLGGRGLSMIPVVDSGRLVGIVTMQNLMHSMSLLAESRRLKRAEEDNE